MQEFSSVQSLSRVWLPVTPWTTAYQASQSITNSRNPPKLMPIESVMPSNHLILCHSLLLPTVQFSSVAQSRPTLCDPMDCSTPGLPVHHQLLELAQTPVHDAMDMVMPSTISSSVIPFSSCLQSFPASGSFSMSQFFANKQQGPTAEHTKV